MVFDTFRLPKFPVKMFNLLLPDVNSEIIHNKISEKLKIEYLSNAHTNELKEAYGTVFGPHSRIFTSLPVRVVQEPKNVHFLINTGISENFISKEVFESFREPHRGGRSLNIVNKITFVEIPSVDSNFTGVNILGAGYLGDFGAKLIVDFKSNNVSISFVSDSKSQSQLGLYILFILYGIGFYLFGWVLFFIFRRKPIFSFSIAMLLLFCSGFSILYNLYIANVNYFV
jgi:hypothetical protein